MPLDFNVGELVDRLRRSMVVRGRMPLELDERVVPISVVQDSQGSPYRSPDQGGIAVATYTEVFAGAGAQNLTIRSGSLSGVPIGNDWLVLDSLDILPTASGHSFRWGIGSISVAGAIVDTFSLVEAATPATPASLTNWNLCTGGVLAMNDVQGQSHGSTFGMTFPLGNILRPDDLGLNRVFAVEVTITAATTLRVNFRGRLFRGLQGQPTPA